MRARKIVCFGVICTTNAFAGGAEASSPLPPLLLNADVVQFDDIPFATVRRDNLWKSQTISVCWENPSTENGAMRNIVRLAVAETWERSSGIVFGPQWEKCQSGSDGIHIRISDERPHVKALGAVLNRMPDGMVLNFTFEIWGERCKHDIPFCMKAFAVHEFGHALGFAHEHNRVDAPPECQRELEDPSLEGNWNLTGYDSQSIMNYCNSEWLNKGLLSERDKKAVSYLYPKSKPSPIADVE